jgi:Ser/Thr protein kinase RdoA (MazF antagonist)
MCWDLLKHWGEDAVRLKRLEGGSANDVWSVRVGGRLAVARLGTRSAADLTWEAELLLHLDRNGMTVPVPISTPDGRPFVEGLMVMEFMEGGPPETKADWVRVAEVVRRLHALTQGWPQRPGWRSSTDLLRVDSGTRINLKAMPAEAVARCRAAWARLEGGETCAVHGNPNSPGNVRMTGSRVALIDWDEAHVDVPDLDLVLPHNGAGLTGAARDIAEQASAAWEAAVCWQDEYAMRRLAEVRAV